MTNSYIYIMSNVGLTTLYIGVTDNLERRVLQHKLGTGSDFTKKYKLNRLIYFEEGKLIEDAIAREKQLKRWHREWKWNLIKSMNPKLEDLAESWYDEELLKGLDPESFELIKGITGEHLPCCIQPMDPIAYLRTIVVQGDSFSLSGNHRSRRPG